MLDFLQQHVSYTLLTTIILFGLFVKKYFKCVTFISNTYKVLIGSTLIGIGFYFFEGANSELIPMYFVTYLLATSFYELIVKYVVDKINSFFGVKESLSKSINLKKKKGATLPDEAP